VLPPAGGSSPPAAIDPLDDLGPFGEVLKDRKPAAPVDDLGPFAAAIHGFESSSR